MPKILGMITRYPGIALGILGGGQLARMLALKAHELGVVARVLSENAADPAAQVVSQWTQGSPSDPRALDAFLRECDVVTFESEFLDARALGRAAAKLGVRVFPKPAHMAAIQDRLTQKRLIQAHRLPTSPWFPVRTMKQARAAWDEFSAHGGLVMKKRRFGYDGNGTFVVRTREELEALRLEIETNENGFIAERLVRFRREFAIMIARGRRGPAVAFPFVESRQENARCLWTRGPLRVAGGPALARKLARFVERIGYVGALGVELFDSRDGCLINELAPRVHNSGHYSLDALDEDQFTAHVKAVIGAELAKPKALAPGFAMLNLLGGDRALGGEGPRWNLPAGMALHWYGKNESRPGRKMGHLNATASSPAGALTRLLRARDQFHI